VIDADDHFERYAPIFVAIFVGPIAMALWFAAVVLKGGTPITEDTYGPQVFAIPALVWSAAQIAICLPAVLGFWFRIRWLAFGGSVLMALFLGMFAVMASGAPESTLLQAVCLLWGGPLAWLGAMSCYAGVRNVG
jgi:hypothetical protein